jgi:diguanylate cyclase (GGDEF)-like protein/PAS domain S-box-containing protein
MKNVDDPFQPFLRLIANLHHVCSSCPYIYDLKKCSSCNVEKERQELIMAYYRWNRPKHNIDRNEDLGMRNDRYWTISDTAMLSSKVLAMKECIGDKPVWNDYTLPLAALAFDLSPNAVMITDRDGTILLVNPSFTSLTGYQAKEIIGKNPRILNSGKQDKHFYARMWRLLNEEGSWSGEIWNRRKNGDIYLEYLTINAVRDTNGDICLFIAVFHDITERKRKEEHLKQHAYHDMLTGLPNRLLFENHFRRQLVYASRHSHSLAVLFIDLDRFKLVNDSFGHAVGDLLLQQVAHRLSQSLHEADLISRLGGDEFNILVTNVDSADQVARLAEKIIDLLSQPFQLNNQDLIIGASVGISLFPDDGVDSATLIKKADIAMYRAKEMGGNHYFFYRDEMATKGMKRLEDLTALRKALANEDFYLVYQPQFDLASRQLVGVEALLRWNHPTIGTILPGDFIPLAEETGLIAPIGEWVLRQACMQHVKWKRLGLPPLRIAVNISSFQFQHTDFVETISAVLDELSMDPTQLELELTESVIMKNVDTAIQVLNQLKDMGITIAVDDFGTGYSSLSYLRRLPIHVVKIDRSFLQDISSHPGNSCIVKAIITMAHSLQLKVVAEGIETEEQLRILQSYHCDMGQGYLFSKPLPAEDVPRLVSSGSRKDRELVRASQNK